jgi:hypothetical protein
LVCTEPLGFEQNGTSQAPKNFQKISNGALRYRERCSEFDLHVDHRCTDHTFTWLLLTLKHLSYRGTEAFISPYEKSVSIDGLLHVGVSCKVFSSQVLLKGIQRDGKRWTSWFQPRCSPMAGVCVPPSLQCRSPTQSACNLNILQRRCSKQSVLGGAHSAPSAL